MRAAFGDQATVRRDAIGRPRHRGEAPKLPAEAERPAVRDPIRTVMRTSVATIDGSASMRTLAEELAEAEVGALVVMSRGLPMSIVSERDLVRTMAEGNDIDLAWAADFSAPELVWAETSDSIQDVARLMRDADVRHIPLREHGQLAGIVSVRDVLSVLLGD